MWGQAQIRPKNENILKKKFSLQWPLSYFDVVFFNMPFLSITSNCYLRDPGSQIYTIFSGCLIYRHLKPHTKNQISKAKTVVISNCLRKRSKYTWLQNWKVNFITQKNKNNFFFGNISHLQCSDNAF